MKVPLEILCVTILIWLGWTQSYQEQWNRIIGQPPAHPAKIRSATGQGPASSPAISQPSPTPAQPSWMRRPTMLDRQN